MHGLIKLLTTYLKEALFQPKDLFERTKKRASSRLLAPLIAIVAAESIFVSVIGALQTVAIHSKDFSFTLLAAATDSFIPLALVILVAFALYVGSNLYYTRQVLRSSEELGKLERQLRHVEAYNRLRAKYYEYLEAGKTEQAYTAAALMVKRYPDELDTDPEFLESLISAIESPQLANIRGMLIEAPRQDRQG